MGNSSKSFSYILQNECLTIKTRKTHMSYVSYLFTIYMRIVHVVQKQKEKLSYCVQTDL